MLGNAVAKCQKCLRFLESIELIDDQSLVLPPVPVVLNVAWSHWKAENLLEKVISFTSVIEQLVAKWPADSKMETVARSIKQYMVACLSSLHLAFAEAQRANRKIEPGRRSAPSANASSAKRRRV